ncbi:MAG: hypothetical protein ABI836_03990 [Gemmatimonadota bacterium]
MRLYTEARAQSRDRKDSMADSTRARMPATETQQTLRRIDRELGDLATVFPGREAGAGFPEVMRQPHPLPP